MQEKPPPGSAQRRCPPDARPRSFLSSCRSRPRWCTTTTTTTGASGSGSALRWPGWPRHAAPARGALHGHRAEDSAGGTCPGRRRLRPLHASPRCFSSLLCVSGRGGCNIRACSEHGGRGSVARAGLAAGRDRTGCKRLLYNTNKETTTKPPPTPKSSPRWRGGGVPAPAPPCLGWGQEGKGGWELGGGCWGARGAPVRGALCRPSPGRAPKGQHPPVLRQLTALG